MSPLLGLPAEGTVLFWLVVLAAAVSAAFMLSRLWSHPLPIKPDGATAHSPLDRPDWHVYEAIVAAAGDHRRVFPRLPLASFINVPDQRSALATTELLADFLVVGADGKPQLAVSWAPVDPTRRAVLKAASVPAMTLPPETSVGDIVTRVREALGDTIPVAWVDRPALMSARLGSTWG